MENKNDNDMKKVAGIKIVCYQQPDDIQGLTLR